MPAKKMLRCKKAISPILATLLLIVITVAAIAITYAWTTTYMGAQTGQAGVLLTKDAISWPNTTAVTLYIRNTGTSDAMIGAVYIGNSTANLENQTQVEYDPTHRVVLANGGVIKITVNYTEAWKRRQTYYFRVVPTFGPLLEFSERAP